MNGMRCKTSVCAYYVSRLQRFTINLYQRSLYSRKSRLFLDIFAYCHHKDLHGILHFLDFEKAFDSVEYKFIFETLEKFIGMIKTLYENWVIGLI